MKGNKIITAVLLIGAIAAMSMTSCKKNDPVPNDQNEEYDKVDLHFIALDSNGVATSDTTSIQFDAFGNPSTPLVPITANTNYHLLIDMYAHDTIINHEIIADSNAHKFFFFSSPASSIGNYVYNDNIGLDGVMSIGAAGDFQMQVLLRHGLDKTNAAAHPYNNPDYQKAGGSNDLNVIFALKAN